VVVTECSSVENHLIQRCMAKLIFCALFIFLTVSATAGSDQEDAASDSVSTAFLQARQAAHLSKLAGLASRESSGNSLACQVLISSLLGI
jgi:hypothetical protein